jgi:hypothetical protein
MFYILQIVAAELPNLRGCGGILYLEKAISVADHCDRFSFLFVLVALNSLIRVEVKMARVETEYRKCVWSSEVVLACPKFN